MPMPSRYRQPPSRLPTSSGCFTWSPTRGRSSPKSTARGGRLFVSGGRPRNEAGDMTALDAQLAPLRKARLGDDRPENVCAWAVSAGLVLAERAERVGQFELAPAELAGNLEIRAFSYTW